MILTVLGAGSWGTAMARLLVDNGHSVRLWDHDTENIENMRRTRENARYLSGARLPDELELYSDCREALKGADYVFLVVPSQAVRQVLSKYSESIEKTKGIISLAKGIEMESFCRMSQIIVEILPDMPYAVLSGPSLARDVANHSPTAITVASLSHNLACCFQTMMMNRYFRVYTTDDVTGVEVGGAVKNIIAIAAGIIDGLKMGDNTRAALITRGLFEMRKLGEKMGGKQDTLSGLSGMGDLIVTCNSKLSRNHSFGELMGKGMGAKEAQKAIHMVVEGVETSEAVYKKAMELKIELPIIEQVYNIIYKGKSPQESILELMTRRPKNEHAN